MRAFCSSAESPRNPEALVDVLVDLSGHSTFTRSEVKVRYPDFSIDYYFIAKASVLLLSQVREYRHSCQVAVSETRAWHVLGLPRTPTSTMCGSRTKPLDTTSVATSTTPTTRRSMSAPVGCERQLSRVHSHSGLLFPEALLLPVITA